MAYFCDDGFIRMNVRYINQKFIKKIDIQAVQGGIFLYAQKGLISGIEIIMWK